MATCTRREAEGYTNGRRPGVDENVDRNGSGRARRLVSEASGWLVARCPPDEESEAE